MHSRCFPQLSFGHVMLYKGAVSGERTGKGRMGGTCMMTPKRVRIGDTPVWPVYIMSKIVLKGTWICVAMKACKDYTYFIAADLSFSGGSSVLTGYGNSDDGFQLI